MKDIDTDVLVIGNGLAGSICALVVSRRRKVTLVGRGVTSTALSTACFSPISSASSIHDDLQKSISFFLSEIGKSLSYVTGEGRLLTNEGAGYQAVMAPRFTMAGSERKDYALLGIHGYTDFDPDRALRFSGESFRPYWTVLPGSVPEGEYEPSEISRKMEDEMVQDHLVEALQGTDEEMIGIPPVYGYRGFDEWMSRLEKRSGRRLFEMVTPLSLPGCRLQDALNESLCSRGCTLLRGGEIIELEMNGGEATSAIIRSGLRLKRASYSALVVASGDSVVKGLTIEGRRVADPFGEFLVAQCSGGNVIESVSRSGIKVDQHLHPYSRDRRPMRNVWAAGSVIAGNSYVAGGGLLSSLHSGWKAAQSIMEEPL